jgi:hypothetical protein
MEPGLSKAQLASRQEAHASEAYPVKIVDRRKLDPSLKPTVVTAPAGYSAGTIVDLHFKRVFLNFCDAGLIDCPKRFRLRTPDPSGSCVLAFQSATTGYEAV